MGGNRQRLDKVQAGLTAKQSFLVWMAEAHKYNSLEDYVETFRDEPLSAWPCSRLPEQVAQAVAEAMKGQPKKEILRQKRQALLDLLFLIHLHHNMNSLFNSNQRCYWTQCLMLVKELKSIMAERIDREQSMTRHLVLSSELPYPLDPETAAAVEAAKENYVLPWKALEEGGEILGWVKDSFVNEGKTPLPDGAYFLGGTAIPGFPVPAEDEVRAAFQEPAGFEKFVNREEFSYGLADVLDAEFSVRYESIVSAMKGLDLYGKVVELVTVPHEFLRETPLVEGEWVDAYVVALAEWGARLVQKGYVLEEPQDTHPFAWYRVIDAEGKEVGIKVRQKLWEQTRKHLAGFPGNRREVEGRIYFSWADYLKWRGRWAKGDLTSGLQEGLVISLWNQWVVSGSAGRVPTLGEVQIGTISGFTDSSQYSAYQDSTKLAVATHHRQFFLRAMGPGDSGTSEDRRLQQKATDWKLMAEELASDLYRFRTAVESINRAYFDSREGLFPASQDGLFRLVEQTEHLVNLNNHNLAGFLDFLSNAPEPVGPEVWEVLNAIDLANLASEAERIATSQVLELVDMAKAEALDMIGEPDQAAQIIEKYV